MAQKVHGRSHGPKNSRSVLKSLKRKREVEDIESLNNRVNDLESKPANSPQEFSELPLSQATRDGLEASHFKKLTEIQSNGIPVSLKGKDVLGAAKTGSGKTLAFIVPVLENLFRKRWTEYDGLGALILSPTRELAIQIFDVLRKVGRNHTFSAGLVIGGKSLQEERERLGRMNILVATPGRILQHMDQTADLEIGNLQMLVLDEADRVMDMGFKQTIDAIVEHLPQERQTLMFSATQTKKVSDLARLSLKEPEFVSVHESADTATPASLQQNYIVTPLPEKLDVLWSFLRANVKKKILVFLSSGKQVRFVYEAFRHLQPGVPLLQLHGRQKQTARLEITTKFSNSKYACLFATDVAARGLDFPAVDWVVQVDCPEDPDTYIHRVGRTARYEHDGRAVLFIDPSEEEGMLSSLAQKRISLERINVKQKKMQNTIRIQLQNMCFKDPELKYLGQKAFISYVRSIHLQKNKGVFNLKELDLEAYAASLGLPGAPKVKFVKGEDAKSRKNMPRALLAVSSDSEEADESTAKAKPTVRTKYDRMFERRNQDVLADHYTKLIEDEDDQEPTLDNAEATMDADEDNDFLSVKRRFAAGDEDLDRDELSDSDSYNRGKGEGLRDIGVSSTAIDPTTKKKIYLSTNPDQAPLVVDSKRREKLLKSKKALLKYRGSGSMRVFNSDDEEDNEGREKVYYEKEADFAKKGNAGRQREKFLEEEKSRAQRADETDKEVARQKKKEKRERRKERERMDHDQDSGQDDGVGVQLAPYNEDAAAFSDEELQAAKRPKKWFERDNSEDDDDAVQGKPKSKEKKKSGKKSSRFDDRDNGQVPETLEDLEAIASGLLAP